MSDGTDIRIAYRGPGAPAAMPEPATPAKELGDAVRSLVEAWNRLIPRNHVRVMTQTRFNELYHVLRQFAPQEVIAAMEWYSLQTWNRQRGAWRTFDAWMTVDCVTQWYESRVEHEAAESRRRVRRVPAAESAGQAVADDGGRAAMEGAFAAMRPQDRYELLAEAKRTLPPRSSDHMVRMQALVMLAKRKRTDNPGVTD